MLSVGVTVRSQPLVPVGRASELLDKAMWRGVGMQTKKVNGLGNETLPDMVALMNTVLDRDVVLMTQVFSDLKVLAIQHRAALKPSTAMRGVVPTSGRKSVVLLLKRDVVLTTHPAKASSLETSHRGSA